eukprot:CAMPEP_0114261540 /NCGR_PEP_ID=MMETSP0058-20121206/21201_1 /TAXON_ID=36894 /ORGANISM="Pyramimonas parkeae, CCMP726" /LENGTH=42 /DNA_ID= /DNA_START= /DNA_END= /DNA_ORIENTATION=
MDYVGKHKTVVTSMTHNRHRGLHPDIRIDGKLVPRLNPKDTY